MEYSLQQTVGRSVKAYRQAQGLSQESFAHIIGVHRTYLGGLERGEYNLTLKSVERVAGLGHATIELTFHPPVTLEDFRSRKSLADHCWRTIAGGVSAANAGRLPAPAAPDMPDQRRAA